MSLLSTIMDDIKQAMKNKDEALSTLRMLSSNIKNKAIELQHELDDKEIMQVVRTQAKQLKESADSAIQAGREDLADLAKKELEVLKKYLPEPLTDEELEAEIKQVIEDLGATIQDMGKVMGTVMGKIGDRVEGGRVQEFVKRILQS